MSFLGAGAKDTSYKPNYTGLQIQTAINTLPIPVGWGRFRVSPNIIWYANFEQNSSKQSAGKGGGGSSTSYTYSADVIMGICEGPIINILQVWKNNTIYEGIAAIGLSLFLGNTPQAGWGYLYANYPTQALTYSGTAFVCGANYQLGSSPSLPNHNYEVVTPFGGGGSNGIDADPAQVINDFLVNTQYGVRFPAASINTASLFSSGAATTTGDAALQTYCKAVGLCFSPVLTNIETAQSVLQRWIKLVNTAVVVSGGEVKFVPFGDQAVTGNGVTYLPNMTPLFNLGDGDFQGDASSDPVQGQITDLTEAYNVERIMINDRNSAYNSVPIEARDEAMVNMFGLRVDTGVSAAEICDSNVGAIVAQLILQRQLYVRNTHSIRLDPRYCGLDPMDIVTLTDSAMGMSNTSVRILQIDEDDTGILTVLVEELPVGVGTAALYSKQTNTSGATTVFATASPVNPPILFEPPPSMTGNQPQIWIGASGSIGGVGDPNWGGANVYVSADNVTYELIGTINQPCKQGALLTALPAFTGANPDMADTLSVDMTQSGGTLSSAASTLAASNGSTQCYVDGEVLSYVSANLSGAEHYALTGSYRGQNGTSAGAHAAGTQFCRLDSSLLVYELPTQWVGQPIYVKLASFNGVGSGLQSLANCTAYLYVPAGAGLFGPVSQALLMGINLDLGAVTDPAIIFDDFGLVTDPGVVPIDLGTVP